jgi:hypothetical protein
MLTPLRRSPSVRSALVIGKAQMHQPTPRDPFRAVCIVGYRTVGDHARLVGVGQTEHIACEEFPLIASRMKETGGPKLGEPEQAEWLQRLEAEHENLRVALARYAEDAEGLGGGLRLCVALRSFRETRGHWSEGRDWYARALGTPGAQERGQLRARLFNGAGGLACNQGDDASARTYLLFEEACYRCRSLPANPANHSRQEIGVDSHK